MFIMDTLQTMVPFNLALLTIAALFYAWRDIYIPARS